MSLIVVNLRLSTQ